MDFIVRDNAEREVICNYLQSLPEGKVYDVTIKLHRTKRSNDANALYWSWIGIISTETGNDRETVHKALARKFLGYDVREFGSEKIAVVHSTASLDTKEFSDYMNEVAAFASSELGIVLPTPGDKLYEMINNE